MKREPDVASAAEVVMQLLHAATSAHLLHLSARSLAAHLALDELYKALPGLVDGLARRLCAADADAAGLLPQPVRIPGNQPCRPGG